MQIFSGRQTYILLASCLLAAAGPAQGAPFAFSASLFPGLHSSDASGVPASTGTWHEEMETGAEARSSAPSDDTLDVPELAELE